MSPKSFFVAAVLLGASITPAYSEYPEKPLTIIVSLAPGGGLDTLTRRLADQMKFGQPVVVENKAGAGGAVAATYLTTRPADGYTVAVVLSTALTLTPLLGGVDYRLADFTPLAVIMRRSSGFIARADAEFHGWEGLIDYAKKARAVTYGSQSQADRLIVEQFAKHHEIQVNVVPTKGSAETRAMVQGGHLDFGVSGSVGFKQTVKGGPFQLLLVTDPVPNPSYPDIPTLKTAGVDIALLSHYVFVAPSGMAPEVAKTLAETIAKAAQDPEVLKVITEVIGGTPLHETLAAADDLLAVERETYQGLLPPAR